MFLGACAIDLFTKQSRCCSVRWRHYKLGFVPIIAVDVDGALNMNKKSFEANFLFIYPPSFEVLRKRIGQTRNETESEFKTRIHEAIKEIEKANNSVLFTNRLVNDTLDDAVD